MSTSLLTPDYNVEIANNFVTTFNSNDHWFFVGDHTTHSNNLLSDVDDDVNGFYYDPWYKMIMGKQLTSLNVSLAIRNIPYEADKIFDMYDDQDPLLLNKDFYCIVNAGSYFHIFECVDNNSDSVSTVQPDFTQISGANLVSYETADGYRWKYMFTVGDTTEQLFSTTNYFPLVPNTTVESSAIPGSINIIKIEPGGEGRGYDNYITGSFKTADIRVGGDPTIYEISSTFVSTANGYYTGCIIYLTLGTGIGQYKKIIDFVSNTNGNFAILDSGFSVVPTNGTQYEIYPECKVSSDGVQTINCVARAIVNSIGSNSIATVEVLNAGAGYTTATANVLANAIVGIISSAAVRPILPPAGGHGARASFELDARHVIVSANLSNSESNTILTTNMFQQIGIIKNPVFSSANVSLSNPTGFYTTNETIYIINPLAVAVNCTSNGTVTIVGDTHTSFDQQFSSGDYVYITDKLTNNQIAIVNVVTNSSYLTLTTSCLFSGNNLYLNFPRILGQMVCNSISSETDILVSNIQGTFSTGNTLIGELSGAVSTVNAIMRNDVNKSFGTFIQLHKYTITIVAGTFEENETVAQGSTTALLHSVVDNNTMYLSGLSSPFTTGATHVVGQTSGAIATITKVYDLELNFGQGELLYLENVEPITRDTDQTETFKLVFTF